MAGNIHHLRGRLRLRFSNLKNRLDLLSGVIESLRAVAGVDAVEASPYTGGMLIHYDQAAGASNRFWDDIVAALAAHGLNHDPRPLKHHAGPGSPLPDSNVAPGAGDAPPARPAQRSALAAAAKSVARAGAAPAGAALVERLVARSAAAAVDRLVERAALAVLAVLL